MTIPNNQEKIAKEVEMFLTGFGYDKFEVTPDDGSVVVFVREGNPQEFVDRLQHEFKGQRVGDGVQEGDIVVIKEARNGDYFHVEIG